MTREKAIKSLQFVRNALNDDMEIAKAYDMAIKALAQEPRKGHWITRPHVYGVTYCSECDFELKIDNTNYCPNCGCKMVEP